MRFFAVLLTMSVGLGCAATNARRAHSADEEESNEESAEPQSDDGDQRAEADEDDRNGDEGARPAKKRKPKRRKPVEAAPEEEEAPAMYRKPIPPPAPPPVEEPEPAPTPAYAENADEGDNALEAEARKRCRWKNVAPYRPEWANSISPPLAQQRKITSKPICPYGTPPAVLRVARQIAVQQTKLKKR